MEFEILHHPDAPNNPFDALKRYLQNPRKEMQGWGENPPVLLGVLVLFLVGLELALGQRVASGKGGGTGFYAQLGITTGLLMLLELIVIGAASSVAGLFEKTGKPLVAFTYLNLELLPFLIFLPITIFSSAVGWPDTVRGLVLVCLVIRVFSRWREVLQLVFRLTRLQTFGALYGAVTAVGTLFAAFLYLAALGGILSLLGN